MLSKITNLGRIIGASAIFYYHVGLVTTYRFSEWGEYAVACFIMISGVAYTCFSSVQPDDLPSYHRYLVGRFKAVFPMFVVINVVIFLLSFFYPSALGRPFSFLELVLSSAGLSQYFGFRFLSKVMWFIPFILQAYLLFPFLVGLLKRIPAPWIVLAAFAFSLAATSAVFLYRPQSALEICRNWSVLFRLPETCLGLIIGQTICQQRNLKAGYAALLLFSLVSCVLATAVAPRFGPDAIYVLSLPWRGLLVTLVVVALSSVAMVITRKPALNLIRLLSTASFPFFLLHGIAILFVYHHVGAAKAAWLGYFLFCWAEAIALTLTFRFIEPSMRTQSLRSRTNQTPR